MLYAFNHGHSYFLITQAFTDWATPVRPCRSPATKRSWMRSLKNQRAFAGFRQQPDQDRAALGLRSQAGDGPAGRLGSHYAARRARPPNYQIFPSADRVSIGKERLAPQLTNLLAKKPRTLERAMGIISLATRPFQGINNTPPAGMRP